MVHEIQPEEVVNSLVSSEPDISFAVYEHLPDEVDSIYESLYFIFSGSETVEVVRIVQVDIALSVCAGINAVVWCEEAERHYTLRRSTAAAIYPIGGEKVKRAVCPKQRVALWDKKGRQLRAICFDTVSAFCGRYIEDTVCCVGKHTSAGVHFVEQWRAQYGFCIFSGEAANFPFLFMLVFQQEVVRR
ncbi:hypothetical protein [Bacteroides cellulolyticus]|uniref:hypothetical protein n=1 Tax=Bacteroides cellulolyticus TaxID=2981780 RepID=UPI0021CF4280|nr:hypothetical protein [Bacteroides cellulolyticus]